MILILYIQIFPVQVAVNEEALALAHWGLWRQKQKLYRF